MSARAVQMPIRAWTRSVTVRARAVDVTGYETVLILCRSVPVHMNTPLDVHTHLWVLYALILTNDLVDLLDLHS